MKSRLQLKLRVLCKVTADEDLALGLFYPSLRLGGLIHLHVGILV